MKLFYILHIYIYIHSVFFVNSKHELLGCLWLPFEAQITTPKPSSVVFGSFLMLGQANFYCIIISTEEVRGGPFGMFFQPPRRLHSSLVLTLLGMTDFSVKLHVENKSLIYKHGPPVVINHSPYKSHSNRCRFPINGIDLFVYFTCKIQNPITISPF